MTATEADWVQALKQIDKTWRLLEPELDQAFTDKVMARIREPSPQPNAENAVPKRLEPRANELN